jgi:hypothetical protein
MNLRFTFSLLFLFIVIGGLVAVTQVLRTSDEIETRERLYRISSSELVQIDIKSKQNEITFEKKDGDWFIQASEAIEEVEVDQERWGGVPFLLGGPQVVRNLPEDEDDPRDLSEYGLAPPEHRIMMTLLGGRVVEVHLGVETPTKDGVYVKLSDAGDLFVVHGSWPDLLIKLLLDPPDGDYEEEG